jgi:DNA-binding beta-propeller fold protein YncE
VIFPSKVLPLSLPQDIAFIGAGPLEGDFYVSNLGGGIIALPGDAGTPSDPNPTPIGIIPSSKTCTDAGIGGPVGIATDTSGNLYVANQGFKNIKIFAPGTASCVAPTLTIGTGFLGAPEYIDVDPAGNVWVSDLALNAIFEFDPMLGATAPPITSIIGKKPHLKSPMGIAISPSAAKAGVTSIYVANNGLGEVDLFENVEDGGLLNIRRTVALKGKRTKLNLPVGLATPPVVPD